MKPLDPRLMRYAHSARRYVVLTAVTGVLTAILVVAQAWLISRIISPVILDRARPGELSGLLAALAGVAVARALVVLVQEGRAHRAAASTIIELRRLVLARAAALGPRWQSTHGADTATLLTRGLDDLEPYFVRYLPQLLLAATVTPMTGAVMLAADIPSTVAVVLTIPLIPVFMILIGRLTQEYSTQRLAAMERLGSQVLDLIAGLPTLKALGRETGPVKRVRALGEAYNATTMSTLRVAFLSGAVLEFITTLSVAIIAVEVGFRLLYGGLDLATGLLVIMIAPEIFNPLRQVGFHFHASANGVAAAEAVFSILETPIPERGTTAAPSLATATIRIEGLSVAARGAWAPHDLTAVIRPGRLVVLTGDSGAGKTTTAQVLLGLLPADRGRVLISAPLGDSPGTPAGGLIDLADIDPATWWEQISWVPQRPAILPGTLLAHVLGEDEEAAMRASGAPIPEAVERAAAQSGLDEVIASLEHGWSTPIGQGGVGLSIGQRQRLALTRALLAPRPLVVLDEPTAHLDAASEAHVLRAVEALRAEGRTIIVIAHRRALIAIADDVVEVRSTHDPDTIPSEGTAPPGEAAAAGALTRAGDGR
ncbi:thiol reductant ABC exporter subunit CydD [Actinomyces gaoshouyii]|uniref:Thiol reductant ABC exporter subunit CydD n=1 Tax=Actinomyces gaoshouyii TaxID=1960083 RepID=A0A8H9HDJ3_9ACTO|nr:thiol reductant ABC exporter subunit CydD [Actinomyces gaoshouyii]GGO99097.1 thiol reductant ABC exporter subunit CydD [Actinomyces gaoshouyii]